MGQLVKLDGYSARFLESTGHKYMSIDQGTYYHIPQWFKATKEPGVYEVLKFEELPEDAQKIIKGDNGPWTIINIDDERHY